MTDEIPAPSPEPDKKPEDNTKPEKVKKPRKKFDPKAFSKKASKKIFERLKEIAESNDASGPALETRKLLLQYGGADDVDPVNYHLDMAFIIIEQTDDRRIIVSPDQT